MDRVRPMLAVLATPGEVPLRSERLVYEPKYDGIRALVAMDPEAGGRRPEAGGRRPGAGGRRPEAGGQESNARTPRDPRPPVPGLRPLVTIRSRNGRDKTAQFPDLVEDFARLAVRLARPLLVDGEIAAVDERDRPMSFPHIQPRIHVTGAKAVADAVRAQPVRFFAFDLLRDGDEDLRRLPFTARRIRLQQAFRPPARSLLKLSALAVGDGRALHRRAEREGWEGLVAKDAASIYEAGRRSPAWRKLKIVQQQAFVVGGWTEPRASRSHFGALLLGVYDGGELRFVGSVGSGFDEKELARVAALLKPLAAPASPFAGPVAAMGRPRWVKPRLVAAVRFAEITPDGHLRHTVYLGLRTDTRARDPGLDQPRDESPKRRRNARGMPTEPSRNARANSADASSGARVQLTSVRERLHELEAARRDGFVDLPGGARLRVTNLWKVFWPALKITKGDLVRYYTEVSPYVLPAVADRPLVMKRFPNGIHGLTFYQQRVLETPQAGVRTEALPAGLDPIKEEEEAANPARFVGGSLMTLLYMAQMAAISQDPWFSTVRAPLEPDQVAIDLDPGPGVGFDTVLDVARWVRDELEALHVPAVPKTSGSRGLHIHVPLPPGTTYEIGQLLCQIVATLVAGKHRRQATVERMVRRRPKGTVYVDYLQNILGKTLATAYSARASDFAGVSTPLTWAEVDEGVDPRDFTIRTAPARFREVGDLWARLRTGRPVDLAKVLKQGAGR